MAADYSGDQVSFALKNLGNYRVKRAQTVALEGDPDAISGATLLALGLRETGLRNVNGGGRWDGGKWIPTKDDKGVFQISSRYHAIALGQMPGVAEGTWGPTVPAMTALDAGHCPQFEQSLRFTLDHMHEAQAYAADHGVPNEDLGRFAVAAHNAGIGGALRGYREGDVDKYSTGGDYSAWVDRHRTKINRWLKEHPGWRVT